MRLRRRAIARAVVTCTTVVGLLGMGSVVGAQAPAPLDQVESPPATKAPTAGSEVVDLRTPNSRTFATDVPGAFQTELASEELSFPGKDGALTLIDASVREVDGELRAVATPADVSLAVDSSSDVLASVRTDWGRVGFGAKDARSTRGEVDGDTVAYADMWPDADLELTSLPRGVKEIISLASPKAANRYSFTMDLPPATKAELDEMGSVVIRAEDGTPVATIPRGWMEDSSLGAQAGAVTDGVSYELDFGEGNAVLTVVLDQSWLDDPARVYPVKVDPSIMQVNGQQDDTYVTYGVTSDNRSSSELRVGTAFVTNHSFVHFGPFDLFRDPAKSISNVQIKFYQTHAQACSDDPDGSGPNAPGVGYLDLHEVTAAWGEESTPATYMDDWSDQPSVASTPFTSVKAMKGCVLQSGETPDASSSTSPGWITADSSADADVATVVEGWIDDESSNHGLQLRTHRESGSGASYGYKKFTSRDGSGSGYNYYPPHILISWSWTSGDGISPTGIFRHSNGVWYEKDSSASLTATAWGTSGDKPAPGDYDGDGRRDPGIYRSSNRTFYAAGLAPLQIDQVFGGAGMLPATHDVVPVPADYDGDHQTDLGVFDPADGKWYWRLTATGVVETDGPLGAPAQAGDIPVPGDYNNWSGDGDPEDVGAEPAIYRPAAASGGAEASTWIIRSGTYGTNPPTATETQITWGNSNFGDIPVPANYWGSPKADVAVYRPGSSATWRTYALLSGSVSLGGTGDVPQIGDFNGDGYDDRAVYTPSGTGAGAWNWRKVGDPSPTSLGSVTSTVAGDIPTLLPTAIYDAYFAATPPGPETTSADITYFGDDTFRALGSTTPSGETTSLVDLNFGDSTNAIQFPVWLPDGRIAISSQPNSNQPIGDSLTDMQVGVIDPNAATISGVPAPGFHKARIETDAGEAGLDHDAPDVADVCASTRGTTYSNGYASATTLHGVSSLPHHDDATISSTPISGMFPALTGLSASDLDASGTIDFGTDERTTDDLYGLAPSSLAAEVYPVNVYQLVHVVGSGPYNLVFDGQTTASISASATAADLETALENLSNVDDVLVAQQTYVPTLGSSYYAVRFLGAYRNELAPLMTVQQGSSAATVEVADTSRDDGQFGECEVLPTGDIVVTQYADRFDLIEFIRAYTDNPATTRAQILSLVDGLSGARSGRIVVLGPDGTLKGYLQIPNVNDAGEPLLIHPRNLSVDVEMRGDKAHFAVVYDAEKFELPSSGLLSPYDKFPLQEFEYDPSPSLAVDARIHPTSELIVPPATSGGLNTRFTMADFTPDGTIIAGSAACGTGSTSGACFPGYGLVAFPLVSGAHPFTEDPVDVDYVYTPYTGYSGVEEVLYSAEAELTGEQSALALNFDSASETVLVTTSNQMLLSVPFSGGSFGTPLPTVDLGGCALRTLPGEASCWASAGSYTLFTNKATFDPVNRRYVVSLAGLKSTSGAYGDSSIRSFEVSVNLRRLVGI